MAPDLLPSSGARLAEILSAMLHSALTWEQERVPTQSLDGDQTGPLTGTSSGIHCHSDRSKFPIRILTGGTANDDREFDEKRP